MRSLALTLALLLVSCTVGLTRPSVQTQTIPLSEVSGAVHIGDDRVLLVADEGYDVRLVSKAEATFKAGDATSFKNNMKLLSSATDGKKDIIDDLEDVAWDKDRQAAFVITSHSRSKKQDQTPDPKADKPERHKLARFIFKAGSLEPDHQEIDVLEEALKKFPFVSEAMKKPHQEGGNTGMFNIEGLAFNQETGQLLIGLRSPTQDGASKAGAVVLVLKNPHELFDKSAAPQFDPKPTLLDLGGLGIRGMTYDAQRKGYWIVAGRSADPDDPPANQLLSVLWFWSSSCSDMPPQKVMMNVLGLENLEDVCLLDRDARQGLLLISDDGKGNGSRYVWIPMPQLSVAN